MTFAALLASAAPAAAQSQRANPGVGETEKFGARITSVAANPERVTYELQRAAFVTIIVIDGDKILSIVPDMTGPSKIETAGPHVAGLVRMANGANRAASLVTAPGASMSDPTAADYEKCMARAAQYAKAAAAQRKVVVGTDSKGQPIYGPADPTVDETMRYEQGCNGSPQVGTWTGPRGPVTMAVKKGRYLFLYATDTPVDVKTIEALAITETDPKLMALAMGKKLFAVSGAIWAGYYTAW
jgi:hypothetical protein